MQSLAPKSPAKSNQCDRSERRSAHGHASPTQIAQFGTALDDHRPGWIAEQIGGYVRVP
jgi:hypothetical protein